MKPIRVRRPPRDPLAEALRSRGQAEHLALLIEIVKGLDPTMQHDAAMDHLMPIAIRFGEPALPNYAAQLEAARKWVARACRLDDVAIIDRLAIEELRELAELERQTDEIWADAVSRYWN